MNKRYVLAAIAAATLTLTACGGAGSNTTESTQPTAASSQTSEQLQRTGPACDDAAAKPTVSTTPSPSPSSQERTVNLVKPTTVCDYSIYIDEKTQTVNCQPYVGFLSPTYSGKDEGFLGEIEIMRFENFVRINWDVLGAHVVIVNGIKWGYIDGPGPNTDRTTPMALGTLLYTSDWGQIDRIDFCGWGM